MIAPGPLATPVGDFSRFGDAMGLQLDTEKESPMGMPGNQS